MRSHHRKNSTVHLRRALFAIVASVGLAAPTFAATYNFIPGAGTTAPGSVNGSSGDWNTVGNWATGTTATGIPGAADQASSSSGATATITTAVPVINELRFANNAPGAALNTVNGMAYTSNATSYLTINSGGVLSIQSTNGTSNGDCTIGNSAGASGTLTVNPGATLTVGGTVTQTGETLGGLDSLVIGNSSSSTTVQGPTSYFYMNGGTVTVANNMINGYGATLNTDKATSDISTGYTTQAGGTIIVAGAVIIGSKGLGTYTMTGGSLSQTGINGDGSALGRDAFYLGQQNTTATSGQTTLTGGQGTFSQSGTAVVNIANGLYIANQSNTKGTYTISGGKLTITGDLSVAAAFGAGVGTAALTTTAATNNPGTFQVNGNAASTITANHMTANTANSTLAFGISSSAGTSLISLTAGDGFDGSAQLSASTLVDLDPLAGFTPAPGDVYTLITATSISALPTLTLDGDAFDNSSLSIITNTDGTQSLIDTIPSVPEPTTLSLLALTSLTTLRRRK
jgi:hypothetical protein